MNNRISEFYGSDDEPAFESMQDKEEALEDLLTADLDAAQAAFKKLLVQMSEKSSGAMKFALKDLSQALDLLIDANDDYHEDNFVECAKKMLSYNKWFWAGFGAINS